MRNLAAEGIILRKQTRGENDHYVTIYSPVLGRIQAVAKGSRKIDSSFTGHLETMNLCQFMLYRNGQYLTITECKTRKSFKNIRDDFERSLLAILLLEIFLKSTSTPEQGQEIFSLVENTLDTLETTNKTTLTIESFKIKLMELLGVMPNIAKCSSCSRRWIETDVVMLDAGGHLWCGECLSEPAKYEQIPFRIVKLVNYIARNNFKNIEKIALTPHEETALKTLSNVFLHNYISTEIVSERILSQF